VHARHKPSFRTVVSIFWLSVCTPLVLTVFAVILHRLGAILRQTLPTLHLTCRSCPHREWHYLLTIYGSVF